MPAELVELPFTQSDLSSARRTIIEISSSEYIPAGTSINAVTALDLVALNSKIDPQTGFLRLDNERFRGGVEYFSDNNQKLELAVRVGIFDDLDSQLISINGNKFHPDLLHPDIAITKGILDALQRRNMLISPAESILAMLQVQDQSLAVRANQDHLRTVVTAYRKVARFRLAIGLLALTTPIDLHLLIYALNSLGQIGHDPSDGFITASVTVFLALGFSLPGAMEIYESRELNYEARQLLTNSS